MSDLAEIFNEYKNSPIVLYGLGVETQKAIIGLSEYNIVGLLDSFREKGFCFDKPIISLSDCIKMKVKLIIVVARPGSCRAIAKRIGDFCIQNQIALFDIRGKDLCIQNKATYDFHGLNGISKKQLGNSISEHDAISFDLFDTLIMRQVLSPTDVIELVNCKLQQMGIFIDNFYEKRLHSEKELSKYTSPTLEEIYDFVLDNSEKVAINAKQLADIEWSVDYSLIIPRCEMVELLSKTYNEGKQVYIITDTFYTKIQLEKILNKCNIVSYTDILASCEYKTGKTQKLFYKYKDMVQYERCLHIGDDLTSDIESASNAGIDTCHIYSALDLLEALGYLGMWDSMKTIASRIKIGMFAARIFNSPFQFETKDKKLSITSAEDIGYLFMAPMITDFTIWLNKKLREENINNVWFGARDGYLIKRLYDILTNDFSIYFLTSRIAAVRAGIENDADIEYIAGMKYSGTLQKQLKERFDIDVDVKETEGKNIYDFKDRIIAKTKENKSNYQKYINKLPLKEGDIAFFDFVAKGTTQLYIGKLTKRHIKGLYFLQLEKEYMQDKGLDIISFYDNAAQDSAIYDNYYILETILTSNEASVVGFDKEGRPIYANETREEQDIQCFLKVQQGILEYFDTYIKICPGLEEGIDKSLDELFLELIHKLVINNYEFINLMVEDPFFNRTTRISDLL